jgi:hypothetical protein
VLGLLALAFPGVLLLLLLAMERVEAPLRVETVGERLVHFLDSARADEVETYVSEDLRRALDRYWRRRSRRARVVRDVS